MNLSTPSARICAKLDLAYPIFRGHSQRIWKSPHVRQLYPAYLRTMHMVVRSAVPLMQAALDEAALRGPSDPLCAELVRYYRRHIKEESGHDQWLLEDLQATGSDELDAVRRIPSRKIAELAGAQYYWLHHYHPVSLLGHITAMENYHPPSGFADYLAEVTEYPKKAFRAISRHETLDVHHRRELMDLLDRLPFEPQHERVIALSGLHTLEAGIDVLTEIRNSVGAAADGTRSAKTFDRSLPVEA